MKFCENQRGKAEGMSISGREWTEEVCERCGENRRKEKRENW